MTSLMKPKLLLILFFLTSLQLGHSHSHIDSPSLVSTNNPNPESSDSQTPDCLENSSADSSKSHNEPVKTSLKGNTLVVMILLGDVIHSLNDGMAIGGAFSKSSSDGLSTSLAVLFHEVPHVVGQYIIICTKDIGKIR
jgi:zinc transporter ZupT